jgi:hypothetical protein
MHWIINLLGINNLLVFYGCLLLTMDAALAAIFNGKPNGDSTSSRRIKLILQLLYRIRLRL